jgi:RNA polymerase-binding transcription factor DksA
LKDLGTLNPETGEWVPKAEQDGEEADPNDMGDRNEEFSAKAETLNTVEMRYKDIVAALGKLEANDGSYGKCEISGEMIEEDRLTANPAARTCKEHM